MSRIEVSIERVAPDACWELVALRSGGDMAYGNVLPMVPGAVKRTLSGQLELLHFAPGRWLAPALSRSLEHFAESGAVSVVDVEGKWQRRILQGRDTLRLLASGADVEAMLADRDCAALSLFDCPVVVARNGSTIDLWVHSSYANSLDEQLSAAFAGLEYPSALGIPE